MKFSIVNAYFFLDETVVEYNPEFADMGNPQGAIYQRMVFVASETISGRRFIHQSSFEIGEEDKAQLLVNRILAKGKIDLTYWAETYKIYGSPAWQEADDARQYAHEASGLSGFVRDY
jgi:hypothetical protein